MLGPGSKTSRNCLLRIWSAFLFPTKFIPVLEVIAKVYLLCGFVFRIVSTIVRQLIIQMQKMLGDMDLILFVLKFIIANAIHEIQLRNKKSGCSFLFPFKISWIDVLSHKVQRTTHVGKMQGSEKV